MTSDSGRNEQGSIIGLLAVLAAVLLTFAAMAIDLTLLATSREQANFHARLAVLAAIEEYFDNGETDETLLRAAVLNRAKDVTNARAAEFANIILSDPDQSGGITATTGGSDPEALLEAGKWYFTTETDENDQPVNPCLTGENPPCFVPVNTSEPANAFRLTGRLYPSVTTKIAGGILGLTSFAIEVHAVATVVPRHGCFVVDLSPSMTRITHVLRPWEDQRDTPSSGRGSEYALFPQDLNSTSFPLPNHDYVWEFLNTGTANPAGTADTGLLRADEPNASSDIPVFQRMHYYDDYVLKKTLGDSDFTARTDYEDQHPDPTAATQYQAGPGRWYRVDAFRSPNTTPNYRGPEPLRTVFEGLRHAVTLFQERHVAGDALCLIFYDHRLSWPRVATLTDNFDYLLGLTDFNPSGALSNDPTDVGQATVTSETTEGLELTIRHALFPGANTYTNSLMAMSEALNQLANGREEGVPTTDFVTFIGDGLTNCATSLSPACQNDYNHYKASMASLLASVENNVVGSNIPLHVIQVGDHVQPHTIDIAKDPSVSGPSECLSDSDARVSNRDFVFGGLPNNASPTNSEFTDGFAAMSATAPFLQSNADMYKIAKLTRGIWAPLRPTAASCTESDPATRNTCTGTPTVLSTDPFCRSYTKQITAYMDQIIGDNPYILVEVD